MTEYTDKDIKDAVKALVVRQGVSKEGNSYTYLDLVFENEYSTRIFLNNEKIFAVKDACDKVFA